MTRRLLFLALLVHAAAVLAFADEDRDWGLSATRDIRQPPYSAPTPLEVPGARTASTEALREMLPATPAALLVDVASGEGHLSLKGAVWLPIAGRGVHYFDPVQAETADRLSALTG